MQSHFTFHLLQMELTTSSEQPKITSPNDTKAILKHVSCYTKSLFLPLVNMYIHDLTHRDRNLFKSNGLLDNGEKSTELTYVYCIKNDYVKSFWLLYIHM